MVELEYLQRYHPVVPSHIIPLSSRFYFRGKVLKSEKLVLFIGNVFFFLLFIFILGVHTARYYKLWEEENKARMCIFYPSLSDSYKMYVKKVPLHFIDFSDCCILIKRCVDGDVSL